MDFTHSPSHVSLCAGYAGIDLGLRRVVPNLRTIAACEIEAFAVANLVAKMEEGLLDPAPVWTDLKTFPWAEFRDRVRLLSGGYPCQPFSSAGKRLGSEDPRHLWPFIRDGIELMRPDLCFFENVEGHISLGLSAVLADLEAAGYRCAWGIFSAAEVGLPHRRKRVFILAHRIGAGLEGFAGHVHGAGRQCDGSRGPASEGCVFPPARPGDDQFWYEPPRVLANGDGAKRRQNSSPSYQPNRMQVGREQGSDRTGECCPGLADNPSERRGEGWAEHGGQQGRPDASECSEQLADAQDERPGEAGQLRSDRPQDGSSGHGSAEADGSSQPPLGRAADEPSGRLVPTELFNSVDARIDELRLLGNGVVPAVAARAFTVLLTQLLQSTKP